MMRGIQQQFCGDLHSVFVFWEQREKQPVVLECRVLFRGVAGDVWCWCWCHGKDLRCANVLAVGAFVKPVHLQPTGRNFPRGRVIATSVGTHPQRGSSVPALIGLCAATRNSDSLSV